VGGVVVDPAGCCLQHFPSEVPVDFMRRVLAWVANPIYELELLPIRIAIYAWGGMLKSTYLVCYLDDDAAIAALCKVYGSIEVAHVLLVVPCNLKVVSKQSLGTQGVPSHSNISNGPSRLDYEEVGQLGSKQIEIDWEIILENLFGVSGAFSKKGRARAHRMIPNCFG